MLENTNRLTHFYYHISKQYYVFMYCILTNILKLNTGRYINFKPLMFFEKGNIISQNNDIGRL